MKQGDPRGPLWRITQTSDTPHRGTLSEWRKTRVLCICVRLPQAWCCRNMGTPGPSFRVPPKSLPRYHQSPLPVWLAYLTVQKQNCLLHDFNCAIPQRFQLHYMELHWGLTWKRSTWWCWRCSEEPCWSDCGTWDWYTRHESTHHKSETAFWCKKVTEEEILKSSELVPPSLKPVPGTMSVHQVNSHYTERLSEFVVFLFVFSVFFFLLFKAHCQGSRLHQGQRRLLLLQKLVWLLLSKRI